LLRSRRGVVTAKLTIIRNPASDREFERAIEVALRAGVSGPSELEAQLRQLYPRALVRPRDLAEEPIHTWYVYREGRWIMDA
jgi:hypothetical protein